MRTNQSTRSGTIPSTLKFKEKEKFSLATEQQGLFVPVSGGHFVRLLLLSCQRCGRTTNVRRCMATIFSNGSVTGKQRWQLHCYPSSHHIKSLFLFPTLYSLFVWLYNPQLYNYSSLALLSSEWFSSAAGRCLYWYQNQLYWSGTRIHTVQGISLFFSVAWTYLHRNTQTKNKDTHVTTMYTYKYIHVYINIKHNNNVNGD